MFTLRLLYRKAGPVGRVFMLALIFFIFFSTIARIYKAVQATQERNSHVHTRRSPR
jgi:hypothetical protein